METYWLHVNPQLVRKHLKLQDARLSLDAGSAIQTPFMLGSAMNGFAQQFGSSMSPMLMQMMTQFMQQYMSQATLPSEDMQHATVSNLPESHFVTSYSPPVVNFGHSPNGTALNRANHFNIPSSAFSPVEKVYHPDHVGITVDATVAPQFASSVI